MDVESVESALAGTTAAESAESDFAGSTALESRGGSGISCPYATDEVAEAAMSPAASMVVTRQAFTEDNLLLRRGLPPGSDHRSVESGEGALPAGDERTRAICFSAACRTSSRVGYVMKSWPVPRPTNS